MSSTVTTLDGRFWNTQDLLDKMHDDEFYYGYLGENALSSSACSKLLDSPKKYRDSLLKREGESQALRDGWLFHCKILEPHKWNDITFVEGTKASKAYKEALKSHEMVYTNSEKWNAEDLAEVFLSNSRCLDMVKHTRSEVPAIGEIMGMPFRAKADILGDGYIVDLKTTTIRQGGSLKDFKYSADKWNYDMQMYIYCTLFDIPYDCFTFAVIDKTSKGLGIFECSKDFYLSGKFKLEQSVQIYRDYFIDKKKDVTEFYLYDVL